MIAFEELLKELGELINMPDLAPDELGACLILNQNDQFPVQLELQEPANETLLITSLLGEVPVGRFREDVLTAALRENGTDFPRIGTLAFSHENNNLVLFDRIPESQLTAEGLHEFLSIFTMKGRQWRDALQNNTVPDIGTIDGGSGTIPSNPFGM